MSEPFIHWYTSDFLNAVVDLECELVGAYTILLTLMADKGGPLEDDMPWLARRCNLSTRKMRDYRNRLIELGKLEERNGMLGNRKMLQEVRRRQGKSNQASAAAQVRWDKWRAENKPQLPLDKKISPTSPQSPEGKTARKTAEKEAKLREINGEINDAINRDNSQNSANPSDAGASRLARAPEPEPESLTQPTESLNSARDLFAEPTDRSIDSETDLTKLLQTVSAEAGFVPRGADRYAEAIDFIRQWRDDGIDFASTVLPCIRRIVAESSEPTNSLKRFDRQVRHDHARSDARKAEGLPPPKPREDPIFSFDDEDEAFVEFRQDLLNVYGAVAYSRTFHPVRFRPNSAFVDDKVRIEIGYAHDVRWAPPILDGDSTAKFRALSRKHGYSDVIEIRGKFHDTEQ